MEVINDPPVKFNAVKHEYHRNRNGTWIKYWSVTKVLELISSFDRPYVSA